VNRGISTGRKKTKHEKTKRNEKKCCLYMRIREIEEIEKCEGWWS
jgi:hypothetical protein